LEHAYWQEGIIAPCFTTLVSIFERKNFYYPNVEYRNEMSEEVEQKVFEMFEKKNIINVIKAEYRDTVEDVVFTWENEPILRKVYTEMLLDNQVEPVSVEDINYYFSRALDVHKGAKPTEVDILNSQRKTTGITSVKYTINGKYVTVWDCGGQVS